MTRPDAIAQRLRSFGGAAARRARAEAWVFDAARATPVAKRARLELEQMRVRRLVRRSGSVDAALDQIVAEALASVDSAQ